MAVNLSPIWGAGAQLFDNSGNVLTGGKIYTYAAGTTTPATTYTSSSGITANSNPIILNSAGRVPYEIWLSDTVAYKFVLKDSNDTLIATYDNLVGINSNFIAYTAQQEIQTATAGQTVFNLATMQYQPATNNLSVFVDGVNQYGPGAQYAYVETDSDTVTFVSGLHVGASVKFTTASPVASAVMDAENVSYNPPFTGAVGTNVELKLAQTVSVKDFGAVGDGVTDDTDAIQAAIDYWLNGDVPCTLTFPNGEYVITDVLLCSPQQTILQQKVLFGYGATIINQSATKALQFITTVNKKYWANAVIEGLTIDGGVDCFSFEAGGPTNSDWMYQFTLKNLNALNFSGIGFYGYDGFFESAFYSCVAWGAGSNTTGYGFKFENGPSSVISSIDIYNANTRYCKNGIRTINPVADVDIFGGTFILAQEEGIRLELAQGSVISGVHVEQNWQAGGGTIRAGIRYSGFASLVGITAQSGDATKQNYGAQIYSFGPSFLSSCHAGGAGHTAFGYYTGGTRDVDVIYSMGITNTTASGAQVSNPITSSGTYLPTVTGVTNVTSATAATCQYARNGETVTVSGFVTVVATAGTGTATEVRMSLPIASNFASGNQCAGAANYYNPTASLSAFGIIRADQTNDEALLQFNSNIAGGGGMPVYFTYTYLLV